MNNENEFERLIERGADELSPRERCRQAITLVLMVALGLSIGCAFVAIREVFGLKT